MRMYLVGFRCVNAAHNIGCECNIDIPQKEKDRFYRKFGRDYNDFCFYTQVNAESDQEALNQAYDVQGATETENAREIWPEAGVITEIVPDLPELVEIRENAPKLRDERGNFPAYSWPGGYPIYYLTEDGKVLCADCANRNKVNYADEDLPVANEDPQWHIIAAEAHLGGDPPHCYNWHPGTNPHGGNPEDEDQDVDLPPNFGEPGYSELDEEKYLANRTEETDPEVLQGEQPVNIGTVFEFNKIWYKIVQVPAPGAPKAADLFMAVEDPEMNRYPNTREYTYWPREKVLEILTKQGPAKCRCHHH